MDGLPAVLYICKVVCTCIVHIVYMCKKYPCTCTCVYVRHSAEYNMIHMHTCTCTCIPTVYCM